MAKISFCVYFEQVEGDYGLVDGISAVCSRCNHEVEVFGQNDSSISYAACKFRDECLLNESNFYTEEYPNIPQLEN